MSSDPTIVPARYVNAAILLVITMMAGVLWMPATLGLLAQGYGLGTGALSSIASLELVGFVLATFYTSSQDLGQLKRSVFLGCGLLIAANLCAPLVGVRPVFWLVRLTAGLGAGMGFGYGLKVCAMSERPTRYFGIFTGAMSIVMIVGFQSIAHVVESHATRNGAVQPELIREVARLLFCSFALLGILAGIIYWKFQPPVTARAHGPKPFAMPGRLVTIGLLAVGIAFMGQGSVWALLQILGISHGFSVRGVANAMSAFAIMGVVGSLVAAVVPQQITRSAAMAAALLALWCGLYALYAPRSLAWYVVGCAIGGFYWNFILPLLLGLLARIDRTGNGAVLGGMMSSVGSALGPLLAGLLIRDNDYQPVGWLIAVLCLVALACAWFVERSENIPAVALTGVGH